jgi:hypothetical protein
MPAGRLPLCLIALLAHAAAARATVFTMPTEPTPLPRQEVFSKNGAFVLVVDPEAQRSVVYAANDRTLPMWSIPGVLKTDVRRILLADSGSVVALIRDGAGANGDPARPEGVRLLDRNGASWSYEIAVFNDKPALSYGCGPTTVNWFDAVIDHGDRFVIRTLDGKEHSLDYTATPRRARWPELIGAGVIGGVLLFLVRIMWRRPAAKRPEWEQPAVEQPAAGESPA